MNSNQTLTPLADLLVVDDTPDNLRLLSTMLSEQGYKVRKLVNGQLALRVVSAAPPDLILLDVNMPRMNGYEVCEQLKANPQTSEIPVIFISALDEVEDKVRAFDVGGVDYITKPFQCEEVLARIKNQLTLRSLSKQLSEQNALLQREIHERQQVENALRASEAREREKATQLELTLNELKRAQAQLIQSEKMSSLGQMVAGVAHEINNPVSFIYCNLNLARQYVHNLLRLIETYQQTYAPPTSEIQHLTQEIDLDFLQEDWQKLMDSMQMGAERIHKIVRSLQIFSRLNKSDRKPVDIHEGIDHTLLLLQHRLRAEGERREIAVVKEYGQLPLVTCYASQPNQVFMNLLNNAIDALEESMGYGVWGMGSEQEDIGNSLPNLSASVHSRFQSSSSQSPILSHPSPMPTIRIRTEARDNHVIIRIADNGTGMSENVQKKVFDPFFTTKPVGSGTGLGLAISYQVVVEQHKGQLSCVSTLGQGTELIVQIPILSSPVDYL